MTLDTPALGDDQFCSSLDAGIEAFAKLTQTMLTAAREEIAKREASTPTPPRAFYTDLKAELLKDPEVRAEYEALGTELQEDHDMNEDQVVETATVSRVTEQLCYLLEKLDASAEEMRLGFVLEESGTREEVPQQAGTYAEVAEQRLLHLLHLANECTERARQLIKANEALVTLLQ